jgi:hypothetical protein
VRCLRRHQISGLWSSSSRTGNSLFIQFTAALDVICQHATIYGSFTKLKLEQIELNSDYDCTISICVGFLWQIA